VEEPLLTKLDPHGVCTLTLARPDKHNALNAELIAALLTKLRALEIEPRARLVILTSQGDTFCSGADLDWLKSLTGAISEQQETLIHNLAELLQTIASLSKPTIARVQGPAYGGGVGLIAACDIAIAAETATFSMPELRLGLIPAVITPHVVKAIGARAARRLFLSGKTITSTEALRLGLLHEAVANGELDKAIEAEVSRLLKAAPGAIADLKHLLGRLRDYEPDATSTAADLIARLSRSEEAREGITAFLEKRKPSWLG
jgi:methylglutaconyl-CoA hydratase